jgi:hypothetical protein
MLGASNDEIDDGSDEPERSAVRTKPGEGAPLIGH